MQPAEYSARMFDFVVITESAHVEKGMLSWIRKGLIAGGHRSGE